MPYRRAERKSDDTFVDRKGARQNQGKYEHETLLHASSVKLKKPGEERTGGGGKSSGRRSWLGMALFNHGCWEFHTLTLVQLVLLHDVVLQLGAHVLLLLLD